jgi:hypothetical protein
MKLAQTFSVSLPHFRHNRGQSEIGQPQRVASQPRPQRFNPFRVEVILIRYPAQPDCIGQRWAE